MIIEDKIIVKNYKCFDKDGGGFDKIMPINIIIGKNNSGKSSLIDLVNYYIKPNIEFLKIGRDGNQSDVYVVHKLDDQEISQSFRKDTSGGEIGFNHYEYGKHPP